MELALIWYTLLNLVILGLVLMLVRFARASRGRAAPNERPDLEENALVAADWEMVRRERCLPSGCPRVTGQPPRPRKDVTCEVCAATFLEVRLQRLLDAPLASEPAAPETTEGIIADGALLSSAAPSVAQPSSTRGPSWGLDEPAVDAAIWRGESKRWSSRRARRWALIRFGLGIACVAAGAAFAVSGGLVWLIVPGFLSVLVGLALIAWGAVSGAL